MLFADEHENSRIVARLAGLLAAVAWGVYVAWRLRKNRAATSDAEPAPAADESWRGTSAGQGLRFIVVLGILAVILGVAFFVVPQLVP